jgi:hypothetical protein
MRDAVSAKRQLLERWSRPMHQDFSAPGPVRSPFALQKLRVPCRVLQVCVPKFESVVVKFVSIINANMALEFRPN